MGRDDLGNEILLAAEVFIAESAPSKVKLSEILLRELRRSLSTSKICCVSTNKI
jgi:hypothetical protein